LLFLRLWACGQQQSVVQAQRYSLANYLIPAKIMQGWVRVLRGEVEDGVQQAEAALETLKFFPSR
jgi:hypothetical protein